MKHNFTLLAILLLTPQAALTAAEQRPNVIVILADDLGYSDPGCFGGEISTPAIDSLAKQGTRLTQFRNGGMCVVSRASMLTGNWWPKALPDFTKTPLLSEILHDSGYRTALVGKWHLQGHPMNRGFDHFFGFLEGFSDHFGGSSSYRLDRSPFTEFGPDYYSSDQFTDRAIQFITSPKPNESTKPFFLYLSYQAPHNPLQAPKADILRHRGKYLAGWQAIREARFKRQKELGIVSADATLPAYPENLPQWESLAPAQRDLEDLRMSVYAAMVERMDAGIGRLLKALSETGKLDNTLILFLSDNGTDPFSVGDKSLLAQGKLPGDRNSNWQPGNGWAYACVTPWRLYKISQHAGGVTTGGIVRWPAATQKRDVIAIAPLHMIDIMPTVLDAARVPDTLAARDGESFLPLIQGRPWQRKSPLFFQYMDNRAIRTAEWTLAEIDGTGWQLFDTRKDPLETIDLAASNPEVLNDLNNRWLGWWKAQSGKPVYTPESTKAGAHYNPQGDRGSGISYVPSAMPSALSDHYPLP
jgi:arylsulfatase